MSGSSLFHKILIGFVENHNDLLSVFQELLNSLLNLDWDVSNEEVFLEEKFGQEYLSYKTKTRRWI